VNQRRSASLARCITLERAPKSVLRIAELLETPAIANINRIAGFSDEAPPKGRFRGVEAFAGAGQ